MDNQSENKENTRLDRLYEGFQDFIESGYLISALIVIFSSIALILICVSMFTSNNSKNEDSHLSSNNNSKNEDSHLSSNY